MCRVEEYGQAEHADSELVFHGAVAADESPDRRGCEQDERDDWSATSLELIRDISRLRGGRQWLLARISLSSCS